MLRESYPYVRAHLPHAAEYKFPQLLPLIPPPLPPTPPPLPFPERVPEWLSLDWQHSTHIVPAAYPRIGREADLPKPMPFDAATSKEDRRQQTVQMDARLRRLRKEETKAEKGTRTDVLWICMNRYVRRKRDDKGVTLFLAHANGFSKETWEPMIRRVLAREQNVSEIWIWDAVNHGDSAVLNQGKLDSMFHWHEGVRDLLHFLVHYIPSEIQDSFPVHLVRIPHPEYQIRCCEGFKSRQLVMVGHSFGGALSTLSAIFYPILFSALFLIDPVIIYPTPFYATPDDHSNNLAIGALSRRYVWSSKTSAFAQFQASPFFQRWHPEVLAAYVKHCLYTSPDGQVRLKMDPVAEAVVFSDTWTGSEEAWVRLFRGELDDNIELFWVLPGRGEREVGGPGQTQYRTWLRKTNASNVLIDGAGHLAVHERPDELADELAGFVRRKFGIKPARL